MIYHMKLCGLCNKNVANQQHHLFSNTKLNRKLYPDYIHHSDNIMHLCNGCHLNKSIPKWTEKTFCDNFGIDCRSKSGKQKLKNELKSI